MDELREIIKQLQQHTAALIKQDNALQKKNISLEKENTKLKEQLQEKENELLVAKQKLDGAAASSLFTGTEEKENLKKTLDKYLSEIDKCLALLNAK